MYRPRITRLRDLCADGAITADELKADREKLVLERTELHQKQERMHDKSVLLKPLLEAITFGKTAASRFEEGDGHVRRSIAETVFSNLELQQKTLLISAKKSFDILAKKSQRLLWCGRRDSNSHGIAPASPSS